MKRDCDRRWEIDALREGRLGEKDARAFERHAETCAVCAEVIARDERLRRLAAEMPASDPSELALRRTRARVLKDVGQGAPASDGARYALSLCAAVALAVLAVTLVRGRSSTAPRATAPPSTAALAPPHEVPVAPNVTFAGTILREDGARWSRRREGDVERVRLDAGTLRIHVRHQTGVERFLVDLPDGELEVRGTTFLVTASAGTTEQVSVEEGVVLLRLRYLASEVVLEKGETWNARPKKAPGPASPMPAWHPAGSGSAPTPSTTPSASLAEDEGVESYAAAVGLWQGHHYTAAATALHAFVLAHPSAPQLEDASFLEAASLAQVGRPDAAALVAEDHLARFPASFHRRDAALLVARAARDRGECAQVKSVLAPWIDSDTEASQIARECAAADAGSK